MVRQFSVETKGRGLHEITGKVSSCVEIEEGLCTVFVQGIYLWEHRLRGSSREVVVHIAS